MPHLARPVPPATASRGLRIGLALGLVAALVAAGCSRTDSAKAAKPAQVREVGVVTLKTERLAFSTELSGRTVAPVIAEIRPQVGGIIQKRLFTEGSQVKEGQPLYQLDPAPFQAVHASAQANVRKAESTLATARTVARRNAELVKIDAISQQVNEATQAAALQAEADVAVARAAEQTARINLGYTRINSPITGWVELSTVTPGALVTANQATALTTVQQLDPVHVHVTQSSSELLRLKRDLAEGRLQRGNANEAPIKLLLEDGTAYPHPGRLTFSGVTVDAGTGSVTLRALVPNPDRMLMPGMYVRAVLQEGVNEAALLIPQQAVTRAPDGSASTLVVDADNKLVKRPIVVGRAMGNRWQVLSGLAAGERVLVEGSQRARPGDTVRASEVVPTGANPAAKTPNGPAPGAAASVAGTAVVAAR
ncbi:MULTISPECIES: efflux RND transporter periplasmic adaptor subunit [unclassified Variovorax]|uniref:efflux RND transporter periplasmic adaptor subunit n=1 Tax=unclassified Variovorax TaxID=663243 RepID=UPI002574931C|nr:MULTISPECIES: efflux RND transporter periplasmic adaptor subunit [unclassified Variovorax]MDM0149063.1 efflux RND transporter periplasmic adaptor subunit [Variovorax sp. J2P1-31]